LSNFRGSKYRGQFWFPDSPSITARGELTIDKDGYTELAIEGSGDLGVFLGAITPRTILGRITVDYEYDVTLFDTLLLESRVRRRTDISAKISCNCILIGHHIAGRDKPQFRKFDVSMSCLSEWAGLFGFSVRRLRLEIGEPSSRKIKGLDRSRSMMGQNYRSSLHIMACSFSIV